jgi:uncharacterized protein
MQNAQVMPADSQESRGRIWWEVSIVLGLSLGASAVYSIVNIIDRLTQQVVLSQQTAHLNSPLSDRSAFDLTYQLLGIFFALVPVALVAYLLWRATRPHLGRLGVDFAKPARDSLWGVVIVLAIGIPGLVFYFVARHLGLAVNVVPTDLNAYWWTIPVLVLSAVRAGVGEEFIAIGYLFTGLGQLGWGRWRIIFASALLRGCYHLYQGPGALIANFAMGVAFGWLYTRYGRLLPLVIAHTLMDVAVFVGYPWAVASFPALFAV